MTICLSICNVSLVFAADPDDTYFKSSSSYTWSGASGQHSISNGTKLGDLVAKGINYISLDIAALNSDLYQIYTIVNTGLGTVSSNSTDIKNYLNNLNSGWWSDGSAPSGMSLSWYYQLLQAVKSGATDNSGIIYHLSNIYSTLHHWNGTSSVNIADLVADLGDYEEDIASNTAISASNLNQILQVINKTNGKFFEYYTRSNFPSGNFNDITITSSETYGAYHANGDGSYQISSLSAVSDRLEFLAWLHSDLLNIMGMMQTPNSIYKTEYTNADETTTSAISLSLQDSIVLGNRVITDTLSKIYNERKDIDWKPAGNYVGTATTFNGDTYVSSAGNYPKAYAVFDIDEEFNIYHLRVPVTFRNLGNMIGQPVITAYYLNANGVRYNIPTQLIAYDEQRFYTDLIVYIGQQSAPSQQLRFEMYRPDAQYVYIYNNISYGLVEALSYNQKDFYDVQNFVFNFNINKLLEQAKYMFFDDETIAAKKANVSQTTEVINGFTGSGDASASASDFGDIKDSVGSVKSGLNTNVSISNILGIFNNNDGYGFWSDATRQELNSTGNNRANYKTRGVSDTPLYDAKISELYKAMGVKYE